MRPFQAYRKLREAEKALFCGKAQQAETTLLELVRDRPDEFYAWSLLTRAAAEQGKWEGAFDALEQARKTGGTRDGVWILEGEIFISAGRLEKAREAFSRASANNVIAPRLLALLDFFRPANESGAAGSRKGCQHTLSIPRSSVWFNPVGAHLLYFLETELEALQSSPALHKARTTLFHVDLSPASFPAPREGPLEKFTGRFMTRRVRERRIRERHVIRLLREGDLPAAADALKEWLEAAPGAFGSGRRDGTDYRESLLVEILFELGLFKEVLNRVDPGGGGALRTLEPSLQLTGAYSYLAQGRAGLSRKVLTGLLESQGLSAECSHLLSLADVRAGRPERAIPWLRRAARLNDVTMVELARRELEVLGFRLAGAPP